jgi:SPOR domain
MADNNFRGARGRATFAHEDERDAREALRDPLAELARLIGQADPRQSEPRNDLGRDARPNPESFDDAPRPLGADYAADHGRTKPGRYAVDDNAEPQAQVPDQHLPPHDYGQPEGPGPRFNMREPSIAPEDAEYYDDAQDEAPSRDAPYRDNARYQDEDMPESGSRRSRALPPLPPQSYDDGYDSEEQWQDDGDDQSYADQEYEDDGEGRPRRRGLTALVAILMLAGVGAAGAYAYRTVFGGAMLPTLPPVIHASDGPNRIIPPQASASAEADVANSGSGEQLVPREEQPVQIPAQDSSPRSVSTVPVAPQNAALASAPPDGSPFPSSPIMAPPSAPPSAASDQASGPGGPKKIHTVLIRPDQAASAAGANVNLPSVPPPQQASRTKPAPAGKNGHAPLAITPDGQASAPTPEAAPPTQRTQVARAEPATKTPAAAPAPAASAAAGGGNFAVQVTSQRSEQDAQTAFQALQGKYPDQLGNRQPIIRQVDLGDKGVYFRAMVGPYGSRAEAASMCMNLKAAGGSCLVQPN